VLLPYAYLSIPSQPVIRIVITGGPCSGKTTGIRYLKQELEKIGYVVFCLPEVATMMMQSGARLWLTAEERAAEQEAIRAKRKRNFLRRAYFEECPPELLLLPPPPPPTKRKGLLSRKSERRKKEAGTPCPSPTWSVEEANSTPLHEIRGERKAARGKVEQHRLPHSSASFSSSPSSLNSSTPSPPTGLAVDPPSPLKELFQRRVLQNMLAHEDTFYEISRELHQPVVMLIDRGTLDGGAYCTRPEWDCILHSTNFVEEELVEARYDAVMHFVTAADGAAPHYSLANNTVRHESVEEAICQDALTRRAWRSFPYVITIANEHGRTFEEKLQHGLAEIRRLLPSSLSLSPRLGSLEQLGALPAEVQKGARGALRHTGCVFFASTAVGGLSDTVRSEGVQRFMMIEEIDWSVLLEGVRGLHPWVTEKRIVQFFLSREEEEGDSDGGGFEKGETRRKLEGGTDGGGACEIDQLIRVEGHVGTPSRPLYLRQTRVRGQKLPPVMHLHPTFSSTSILFSSSEGMEEGIRPTPSPAPLTFKEFDYTCPMTAKAFAQRVRSGTPVWPQVEKQVYRFFYERMHLQVLQLYKGGWMEEETVQKALRGEHVVVAGPASLTPEMLPKWLKVGPKAYEDSWISNEIIM